MGHRDSRERAAVGWIHYWDLRIHYWIHYWDLCAPSSTVARASLTELSRGTRKEVWFTNPCARALICTR